MQTFLPHESFVASAQCLDRQRLGKQRVEVLQILRVLAGQTKGWKNHPAVLMWKGYEGMLVTYGACICREWMDRGYQDTCLDKLGEFSSFKSAYPPWLGLEEFHLSHRSNLVRKDPEHYGALWPGVKPDLPYYWPTKEN